MAEATTITITAVTTNSTGGTTYDTFAATVSLTPDEFWHQRIECAIGAGETIDISNFGTVQALLVKNTDSANFVNVTRDNAAAATVVDKMLAGDAMVQPDVDPSATFNIAADTAAVVCDVLVLGT